MDLADLPILFCEYLHYYFFGRMAMAGQRVFVIWSHSLFYEAVRQLLRHPQIDIVGATSDHSSAHAEIAKAKPDIVIIENPEHDEESSEETITILREGPKVIRLSLSDNELSIYHRQEQTIADAQDLLHLIIQD
jgi:AmiR/NasT family two-component response regulator